MIKLIQMKISKIFLRYLSCEFMNHDSIGHRMRIKKATKCFSCQMLAMIIIDWYNSFSNCTCRLFKVLDWSLLLTVESIYATLNKEMRFVPSHSVLQNASTNLMNEHGGFRKNSEHENRQPVKWFIHSFGEKHNKYHTECTVKNVVSISELIDKVR